MPPVALIVAAILSVLQALPAAVQATQDVANLIAKAKAIFSKPADQITEADLQELMAMSDALNARIEKPIVSAQPGD